MAEKQKRLTQREKALNAKVKKKLQGEGLLPPDKPRLNRKKFARETWAEYTQLLKGEPFRAESALLRCIGFMVGPDLGMVTPEQVGVLKLLKMTVEFDKFRRALEAEGRDTYSLGELADKVVIPIINL